MKSIRKLLITSYGFLLSMVVSVIADTSQGAAAERYQQICAACHGAKGEGREDARTPSIGGLPAWHIQNQLRKLRNGRRGSHPEDTAGQQMRAIALSIPETELDGLASHIQTLPTHTPKPPAMGDTQKGRTIYADNCMACHRYNASGEKLFNSPPLTSLQPWYISAQLNKYRNGQRGYDLDDEHGRKMAVAVNHLLGDEDIQDLVAYIVSMAVSK